MMRTRAKCAFAALRWRSRLVPLRRRPRPSRPATKIPRTIRPPPGATRRFMPARPCHGFKIVAQQGQTRQQWNDTLDWMTQRHAMPPPSDGDRKILLDYLAAAFPARASRGWQNPFQK